MAEVPPIFNTAVVPCVTPPVPASEVVEVIVPLFVSVTPVIVKRVAEVNVPLFV